MWSIVAKRAVVIAALGLSSVCTSEVLAAAPTESEAKVVARLYKDYAWQAFTAQPELFGEGLAGANQATLEKYFTSDLARLFVEDMACAIREQGICNLDFDVLFDSQDPRLSDLKLTRLSSGKVRAEFKDPVTGSTTRIGFKLVMVGGKWRIADVLYSGNPSMSLKMLLSQPISKD